MLTEKETAAIRERCEKATSGPWENFNYGDHIVSNNPYGCGAMLVADIQGHGHLTGATSVNMGIDEADAIMMANAEFIAHARQDIPALLDALAGATERISALERAIIGVCRCCVHKDEPSADEDSPCFVYGENCYVGGCFPECGNWELDGSYLLEEYGTDG